MEKKFNSNLSIDKHKKLNEIERSSSSTESTPSKKLADKVRFEEDSDNFNYSNSSTSRDHNSTKNNKDTGNSVVREKWPTRRDFYLSCAGSFIGLGNVWRFPYLCYENGGAIFFIPYLVFLFFAGIPLFFLEVSVGQYTSEGGITAWTLLAPITTGIGWGSIVLTTVINTYYIVVLGWSLYYLCASMTSPEVLNKIWNTCGNEWNNQTTCKTFEEVVSQNLTKSALTATTVAGANSSQAVIEKNFMTPIEEYWENRVLQISDNMTFDTLTDINWPLYITVIAAWIVCYFCVWKGLGWTSKVVMFTATFPVIMLLILLVRGITLEGAMKGIRFYMIPKLKVCELNFLYKSQLIHHTCIFQKPNNQEVRKAELNFLFHGFQQTS